MTTQRIDGAARDNPAAATESLMREKVALQNKLIDVQRSLIERNDEVFKLRVEHSAAIERKDAALLEAKEALYKLAGSGCTELTVHKIRTDASHYWAKAIAAVDAALER